MALSKPHAARFRFWPTLGADLGYLHRARDQVTNAYPNVGVVSTRSRDQHLFDTAVLTGLRADYGAFAAAADLGPSARLLRESHSDVQGRFTLQAGIELGFRLFPWVADGWFSKSFAPQSWWLLVSANASGIVGSPFRVEDYRFDLAGQPGIVARDLGKGDADLRVGIEWVL